jgi:hypothetical protein
MKTRLPGNFILYIIISLLVACGGGSGGGGGGGGDFLDDLVKITVNPITADDVVNVAEAAGIINVTGWVSGDLGILATVTFTVNNTPYGGFVHADSTFSIAVSGADLAADTSFVVRVRYIDPNLDCPLSGCQGPIPYLVVSTTSTHTVDIVVRAKIPVDNITDDDVINTVITSASVAILGSIDLDATQVDFSTVTFGRDGASPVHDGHVEDVNVDGFMDLEFHFKTQETGIVCGDTEVTLMGGTFGGMQFTGTDTVKTVECK